MLREVQLARKRLKPLLGELARVGEDGEAVAGKRRVGEDVGEDVAEGGHGPQPAISDVAATRA